MNEVTVILTSSGRWDLLRRTIESFLKFNTYDIKRWIVNDDSGNDIPNDLKEDFQFIEWFPWSKFILHDQIKSLDFLWSLVATPYCMTLEDDWQFTREGFIEDSMRVLESNPTIMHVWINGLEEHNKHPIRWVNNHQTGFIYGILKTEPNLWSGTRFNPSLKRKCDYDLIAPYSKHTTFDRSKPWKSEADISKVYHKLGFKGGILPHTYMHHIGQNQHVGP